MHNINVLDILFPEPGALYVMELPRLRSFVPLHKDAAFFVIRARSNLQCHRIYSHPIDKSTGLRCDQTIMLTGFYATQRYPDKLRRIKFYDAKTGKYFIFLTNNFSLPANHHRALSLPMASGVVFQWIKQHLRIKSFFGASDNAVKTQVWIAVPVYVLIAIIKKQLNIKTSLYSILQILSMTMFETTPLNQLLRGCDKNMIDNENLNQLNLFD